MSSSCDACGWAAAAISCLAFGSFGVPMKSDAADRVDVDPLVFQSYKTIMVLLTSPFVLLLGREYLAFTPWGIVSGVFWVPAGVAAVYAVRSAGLAVSQGVWSSLIVLVSFGWGVGIFGESVNSLAGASAAVALMISGLWGMSFYSSPDANMKIISTSSDENELTESVDTARTNRRRKEGYEGLEDRCEQEVAEEMDGFSDEGSSLSSSSAIELTHSSVPDQKLQMPAGESIDRKMAAAEDVLIWGQKYSRRKLGLASAVFNGVWGGSIMVPMHYAKGNTSGFGYAISFAVGATIVTAFLWILRLCLHFSRTWSVLEAYKSLPSFHFRGMWLPGGISGMLWSIGNMCSMVSVANLGEGVGYSVVQASMLVSGLWGIFYFRETTGFAVRMKWLGAALVTVLGILLLAQSHSKSALPAPATVEPATTFTPTPAPTSSS